MLCQFFITLGACSHLDKKSVAFGRVVEGLDIIQQLSSLGSASGTTAEIITISDCGVIDS